MVGLKISPNGQWSYNDPNPSIESFAKSYIDTYVSELAKSSETSLFKRFEDKYIMPKSLKNELEKVLHKYLRPSYPDKKTKFNLMKSVYFDSAGLDMIKQHMQKATSRFKIRTREYAPDGKLAKSDFMYLEVKAKNGNVTDKFRIKLPNHAIEGFKKGLPIIPSIEIAKANQNIGMSDLVKRISDINYAMKTFNMHPSCEISYVRKAFSDDVTDDMGLRVTFDEGVRYNVLDVVPTHITNDLNKDSGLESLMGMVSGYSPDHHIVLEVKHHGSVPDWLSQFLNDHKVVQTNFSKYCYSMAKHAINNK